MRIQRLDGKAFFRDPEGVAQTLSDGADVVRIGAAVGQFTLLRSPDAIRQVLVADSSSFRQGSGSAARGGSSARRSTARTTAGAASSSSRASTGGGSRRSLR